MRVATTNAADGNTSPFEYDDGTPEIKCLDALFTKILKECASSHGFSVDDIYSDVNRLSKDYQDDRFSPLYNLLTEPLVSATKQLSFESFRRKWTAHHRALLAAQIDLEAFQYQKSKLDKSKTADRVTMKRTLKALVLFDWCMVLTMRAFERDVASFNRRTLRSFHDSAAAMRSGKEALFGEFMKRNDVDVFMLQEVRAMKLAGYKMITNDAGNTGILVKNALASTLKRVDFPVTDTKLHEEILVLVDSDGTYYISAHLNSKDAAKAQSPKNYEDQWKLLSKWLKDKRNYVLGIDANHHPKFKMHAFPKDTATTRKQRTSMQAQQHKIGKLDEGCKDHIVTNMAIVKPRVCMLTEDGDISRLLPNEQHPCDHFIVMAELGKKTIRK